MKKKLKSKNNNNNNYKGSITFKNCESLHCMLSKYNTVNKLYFNQSKKVKICSHPNRPFNFYHISSKNAISNMFILFYFN